MKMTKKLAGMLAVVMAVTSLSACKPGKTTSQVDQNLSDYPVQSEDTLQYWVALNGNVAANYKTLNETPWAAEMEKETGIHVEYVHPAIGKHDEQFSVLIASNSLPDIMEYEWYKYPGGYQKAMNDDLVLDLTPYLDTYLSDYNKVISDEKYSPYIRQSMITEDGQFFGAYSLCDLGDVNIKSVYGPIFRQDWLEELNLEVPETIDEWTTVLTAFKEKKNVTKPLVFIYEYLGFYSILCGTYGVKQEFYPIDGKITYGPMEQGYKEFLTQMNDWYKKGLLDNSFASCDEESRNDAFLNGNCGVTYGFLGGNVVRWEGELQVKDPNAKLAVAKHPSLKKGEPCELAYTGNNYGRGAVAVITKDCKNPDLAAKFLNFGYTDQGSLLYTFGIEGTSYTIQDGEPAYTDLVKNNPDQSFAQILPSYTKTYAGPMEIHHQYYKEYYGNPKQIDAIEKWGESNGEKYDMPYVSVSAEEADELAGIEAKLKQYVDEMSMRFIVGSEPLENFESYVETLKSFGADKAISMYQSAYDKAVSK